MKRRTFLGAGAAATAGRSLAAVGAAEALVATVELNGKTFEYNITKGTDLGNFVSPEFLINQRCIRVTRPDCPLTVQFRPEADGSRVEVVFELGDLWEKAPKNLPAYSVRIVRDAEELANVKVPEHYWFSRWRWQSAPRPVKAKVSDLIDQKLLPPFNVQGAPKSDTAPEQQVSSPKKTDIFQTPQVTEKGLQLGLGAPKPAATSRGPAPVAYTIMGLAGVTPYMGQTGERDDVGLVTGPQGDYIVTGNSARLAVLLAQAEAAGTVPWHMRDAATGAPISFDTYPNASWYYRENGGKPHIKVAETPITPDTAHQPALSYVPYLLTGDPYFLEELQFQATWCWGSEPMLYRPPAQQGRAFAWSTRTFACVARQTPKEVPRWLLPKKYWLNILEQTREFFEKGYVKSDKPWHRVFRTMDDVPNSRAKPPEVPEGTAFVSWQGDFIASVLSWIVTMGYPEWKPAAEWIIQSAIARTDGKHGWGRSYAISYVTMARESATAPFAQSWAEAWKINVRAQKWESTDPDNVQDSDLTYLGYARGAMVLARAAGIQVPDDAIDWATSQIKRKSWPLPNKWRFGNI